MYFIKVNEGAAIGGPLIESNIRALFQGLPQGYISNDLISGYAQYIKTDKPLNDDLTIEVNEISPVENSDGNYVQTWEQVTKVFNSDAESQAAIDGTTAARLSTLRIKRDKLLSFTDKHAMQDLVMTDDVKAYRVSLRDLPATYAENPSSVVWPVPPNSLSIPVSL